MSEKKPKRRRRRKKRKQYEDLRKRIKQGPYQNYELTPASDDKVKMSAVLGEFIEPYVEHTNSEESYRKLLTLAVMAWNASFLPETEQQQMVNRDIDKGIPEGTTELKTGLKDIVYRLIARKKAYFSQYKRDIIDFEVVDLGNQYNLSVASTPDDEYS